MQQQFPSTLLESAVTELSRLPGVGRKTALRLALHLLRRDPSEAEALAGAIVDLRKNVCYCRSCHNISETELCPICADPRRDDSVICVVESVNDVMCIERTGRFTGVYHVLGGLISPMDGVGPEQLQIDSLIDRVAAGRVAEIIFALSATMEGETTSFYIYRRLAGVDVKLTQLARGVSVGNEIEFTDELTLGRSLIDRTPFADSLPRD